MKYIDADKFIEVLEEMKKAEYENCGGVNAKTRILQEVQELIPSLQREQPELPPIGYAETYYQRGLHDGIIKGRINILRVLEDIEKRKATPVLVIKGQEQSEVDLEKACDAYCKVCGHYHHTVPTYICRQACDYFADFKALLNARKEE